MNKYSLENLKKMSLFNLIFTGIKKEKKSTFSI